MDTVLRAEENNSSGAFNSRSRGRPCNYSQEGASLPCTRTEVSNVLFRINAREYV